MKIYLLRHTRVDAPLGICYGQTDIDVLPSFEHEATAIQLKLEGIKWTHCFSSPLMRCRKLAERLATESIDIQFDSRLMELDFGSWEARKWSDFDQTTEAKQWFADYLNVACPSGESYADLLSRIQSFLHEMLQLPNHSNVLIVSHSGPIRAFWVLLKSIEPKKAFDLNIDFGEIIELHAESNNENRAQ